MEVLKKSRTVIRAAFTRNLGPLNSELMKENPNTKELQARLALVREKAIELEEINSKIFEVMLENDQTSEEQLLQETESADEYRIRNQQVKAAVNDVLVQSQVTPTEDIGQTTHATSDMHVHTFKLPKIQLPKFSGELKDWLQF